MISGLELSRTSNPGDKYSVAGWQVQLSKHRVIRNGEEKMLEPRFVKLLTCLLENPNDIVSRKQLEAAVWPNLVVGYDTLSNSISKLRKVLEESDSKTSAIKTIPRVGYRLITDDIPSNLNSRVSSNIKDELQITPVAFGSSPISRPVMLLGIVIAALTVLAGIPFSNDNQIQTTAGFNLASKSLSNLDVIDEGQTAKLIQGGWQNYLAKTPDGFIKAHHILAKAVEMDPNNYEAKAMLAALYWETRERDWGLVLKIGPDDLRKKAVVLLGSRDVENTSIGQLVVSRISTRLGEFHSALKSASRAYELRNGDLESTYNLSEILLLSGDTKGALAILNDFESQPELPNAGLLYLRGLAAFHQEEYLKAINHLNEAARISASHPNIKVLLAATSAKLGRMEKATYFRKEIEANLAYCLPNVTNVVFQFFPYQHEAYVLHLADGLRLAGLED